MWRTDSTIYPVSAAGRGAGASTPWQHDLPPSYTEVMGELPRAPMLNAPRQVLEQVANTGTLWTRASARALSQEASANGPLPKVVVKELDAHLKQRLRTQRKLENARGSLDQLDARQRTVGTPALAAVRGGLFDDEELGVYALFAAQRAVDHYEAKQRQLQIAHVQRMAQLGRRTG
ncbi:MAG: hypothetical protein ACREPD_17840 [Stenotrophomonas sp.]|uniref:hypothetical protein n=1 Tax=Stenotrophomonas sp. TaxID=69392 RepID=UPI003D6D45C2